jgi:hypothetical protein
LVILLFRVVVLLLRLSSGSSCCSCGCTAVAAAVAVPIAGWWRDVVVDIIAGKVADHIAHFAGRHSHSYEIAADVSTLEVAVSIRIGLNERLTSCKSAPNGSHVPGVENRMSIYVMHG